jgi:hypothetical protein
MASNQPTPDDVILQTLKVLAEHDGNQTQAAIALGINRATIIRYIQRAKVRGLHLPEGARSAASKAGLTGAATAGWIVKVDTGTGSRESTYWKAPKDTIEQDTFLSQFIEAAESVKPIPAVRPPENTAVDGLALIPTSDVHVGLVVTKDETGHDIFNRQIVDDRFKYLVQNAMQSGPACDTALLISNGDLTHANGPENVTPRSKHTLRVDGTHFQNVLLAAELLFFKVDCALIHHKNVIVEVVGGNHDPETPAPMLIGLSQRYRNEPRVTVNVSQNEWWLRRWGVSLLTGHHGHRLSPKQACAAIPEKFRTEWGESKEAHHFTGHYHGYLMQIINGVFHHQLPAICPLDTFSAYAPYVGPSGMVSMAFDKRAGLYHQHIKSIWTTPMGAQ